MKDQSDNPSHHERTLLPRRYISLPVIGSKFQDHSDNERENPLPQIFQIFFNKHNLTDRVVHSMVFVTPAVKHWLGQATVQYQVRGIDPRTHCTISGHYHSTYSHKQYIHTCIQHTRTDEFLNECVCAWVRTRASAYYHCDLMTAFSIINCILLTI